MNEFEARTIVCETGRRMVEKGLVAGTWGNVSLRLDEKRMVITPSGMDYLKLSPEDIVIVDIETGTAQGRWKPSVETPLHAAILRARPDANAIIHTHSTYACAVAAARSEIPPILDELAQIVGGSVRTARYALPGSPELVRHVLDALNGRNAVLLANHGAVCLGPDMEKAFLTCLVVEKAALAFIHARALGGAIPLDDADVEAMNRYFARDYGQRNR